MATKSYAEKMNDAKVMLAGLQQNSDRLAKRGLDAGFVSQFETVLEQAKTLDNEQERLKAEVKSKTAALQQALQDMAARYTEARKIVKIEMEPTTWKEFGIQAKR